MLTPKVDGCLPSVVGRGERDVKVSAAGINPSVSEASSDHFNAVTAIVEILSE